MESTNTAKVKDLRESCATLSKFFWKANTIVSMIMKDLDTMWSCRVFKQMFSNNTSTSSLWEKYPKEWSTNNVPLISFFLGRSRPYVWARRCAIIEVNWSIGTPSPDFKSLFQNLEFLWAGQHSNTIRTMARLLERFQAAHRGKQQDVEPWNFVWSTFSWNRPWINFKFAWQRWLCQSKSIFWLIERFWLLSS